MSFMDFCIRNGWESTVYEMLVVDYLILNRDRHGANMEVLRNQRKKTIRLAPLFDHGLSLLSRCESTEAMLREDVMADKPVQCFVGSRSSWENLRLIPRDQRPPLHPLAENDRAILLEGLSEALDQQWLDRIWEMIWKRWQGFYACSRSDGWASLQTLNGWISFVCFLFAFIIRNSNDI